MNVIIHQLTSFNQTIFNSFDETRFVCAVHTSLAMHGLPPLKSHGIVALSREKGFVTRVCYKPRCIAIASHRIAKNGLQHLQHG